MIENYIMIIKKIKKVIKTDMVSRELANRHRRGRLNFIPLFFYISTRTVAESLELSG